MVQIFWATMYTLSPVVCLSATLVRPTQPVEIFGNVSTAFGTLAIHGKFYRDRSRGTPPSRGGEQTQEGQPCR